LKIAKYIFIPVFFSLIISGCASSVPKQEVEIALPVEKNIAPVDSSKESQIHDSVSTTQEVISKEESEILALPIPPQTDTVPTIQKTPNPFLDIQKIAAESFSYAQTLYSEGNIDSAIHFLETFSMLDPLWKSWMTHVNKDIEKFKNAINQEAEKYKTLSLAIINEMATSGDYGTIRKLADSLIALAPNDSLKVFAENKKQQAFQKTFSKVKDEMKKIENQAKQSGDYQKADSLASRLQMRYRDFSDTLKLNEWINSIKQIADLQNNDKDYWTKNNPEEYFKKAKELNANGKIEQALEILNKLISSPLREKALEEKNLIGKAFCKNARQKTASFYTKALKQKNNDDKKKLINQAVENLSSCIEKFESLEEAKQAETDKKILLEELNK
jgi:hypothetical protein